MKKIARTAFLVYLLTWLGVFIFIVIALFFNDRKLLEGVSIFFELVPSASFLKGFHFFYLLALGTFLMIRFLVRSFQKRGFKVFLKRLTLFLVLPLALIISSYKTLVHVNSQEKYEHQWDTSVENQTGVSNSCYDIDGLHRGMSVFGWNRSNAEAVSELVKNNVEWVAVIPFFDQKDEQTAAVRTRDTYETWSRRDSTYIGSINSLHEKGIRVHLKPHLWMNSGWRSNINLSSKTQWDNWFDSYRINMLHFAKMAQENQVELFCIGTELKTSIAEQPEKWMQLIREIKIIYQGQLTYAANWNDNLETIPFWGQLDYIGIQAYFPLTSTKTPDLETIKKGWDEHILKLEQLSQTHDKPILFTEVGYKSEASSTIKPWEWSSQLSILHKQKSDRTQALAYEALFQKLWSKKWFAGLYIWQWDTRSREDLAATNLNFSPRFKPAINVIAKWFGK
jgi:hypothetical protein